MEELSVLGIAQHKVCGEFIGVLKKAAAAPGRRQLVIAQAIGAN
jgi:hypothetical protein